MKKQANNNIPIDLGLMPPQAVDMENAVLGAILLESKAIYDVCDILTPESFYKDQHQKIYAAAIELKEKSLPIDILSITQKLRKNGHLEEIGGAYYVSQLTTNIASSANIQFHAFIIHQAYLKRLAIQKANEISTIAHDESKDIEDIDNAINELSEKFNIELSKTSGNLIDESLIRLEDKINIEPHFLSIINGERMIGIMSKNNLSAFIGKAKSRKSFAITMLAAYLLIGGKQGIIWAKRMKVHYFDTEQSRFHTQKIIERICTIAKVDSQPDNFKIFNIKQLDTEKRKMIIESVIKTERPDVVFIDGIRDLVLDFNDLKESSHIMNWLMLLNDRYNCHISMVIHMNKADSNPRGHLGSELTNRCESVISVTIDDTDKSKSIISAVQTRGESFEPFGMAILEGVPVITNISETFEEKVRKKKNDDFPF